MANLKLSHIYKVYDNGHKAVNDFSIDIDDKEFIVFVGPSGCGKSTTLRMIAGLELITAGDLFIDGRLVNNMEPKDRDIAMVFQSYALYPHMTVYENMAFGLRNRHVPEAEIKQKVLEAAKILDIEEYLDRKPKAMSGGQRQRVALGRAIVRDPKVFLLDEPLSNLDAKLRAQMRSEITKLHKKLATTFIYVTHDQVEAMTMGTRIVVMKLGYVQQIDTPMNLYNKPYNKFVAGFIGTPQMNFFDVTLLRNKDLVTTTFVDGSSVNFSFESVCKVHGDYLNGQTPVILGIRPEHISISEEETGLKCVVNTIEHLGNESIIYGEIGSKEEDFSLKDVGKNIILKCVEGTPVNVGDILNLKINEDKIHLFDKESEITLIQPIPLYNKVKFEVSNDSLIGLGGKESIPQAFKSTVNGKDSIYLEIPPRAIVKGNDFVLKVHRIEEVEGKRLAYLSFEDRYIFALVDEDINVGDNYSFAIENDKVNVLDGLNVLLSALPEEEKLSVTFSKTETKVEKERVLKFHYHIGDIAIEAPQENGFKINAVEGNDCYKKVYNLVFKRECFFLDSEEYGISATVKEIIDYGNVRFAKVECYGQEVLVKVGDDFNKTTVLLGLNGKDCEVWQKEIDMRIC